jgi:predicted SAM-dependent methyltransferase
MKLHLGCGKRNFPGWVNVDLVDLPHIDYQNSLDDLSMFEDNSCDLIYSSHTLEYFDQYAARAVLAEWTRVLKPGGTLRLAVPDFDALIQVYKLTGELQKILGPLYGRMSIRTNTEEITVYHKTTYNFETLRELLVETGFNNVKKYDWEKTEHAEFDDHSQAYFPHMHKKNGMLISLNVEATKC